MATQSRLNDYLSMALAMQGEPFDEWPGWSTGETLIVALVLNRPDVLAALGYTIVEAFDRVDLSAAELRGIERQVRETVGRS